MLCALGMATYPLAAQNTTGSITGRLTDTSGAVVSGAKVTIVNTGTGEKRALMTDASGNYTATLLLPGSYSGLSSALKPSTSSITPTSTPSITPSTSARPRTPAPLATPQPPETCANWSSPAASPSRVLSRRRVAILDKMLYGFHSVLCVFLGVLRVPAFTSSPSRNHFDPLRVTQSAMCACHYPAFTPTPKTSQPTHNKANKNFSPK